jgi:hypothetical protein
MAYITFKPTDYFISKSWDTSAATSQTVTTGMQPDLIWADDLRGTRSSAIYDAVRGFDKQSLVSGNSAETTTTGITSVSATGFVTGVNDYTNPNHGAASNPNMDAYSWKMGTTTGKPTVGETITPTAYSINTTVGQGIYKYTGTGANGTIAHGLSSAPEVVIVKKTSAIEEWVFGGTMLTSGAYKLVMNTTAAQLSEAGAFNSTLPSSTVISLGTSGGTNTSTGGYIMYAFAPVKGYSKFGAYQGTGDVNSQYIYTGFQPSWVMIKKTNSTGGWYIRDLGQSVSGTTPYIGNVGGATSGYGKLQYVYANADGGTTTSNATTDDIISFTSTGFQVTCTASGNNAASSNYMYMAFAEKPIVGSNGTTGVAL